MQYGPYCDVCTFILMLGFYIHTFLLVQFAFKVHHYQTVVVPVNFFFFLTDFPLFKAEFAALLRTVAATQ